MGKVFRIGHLGWLNEGMIGAALTAAEMAMIDCGIRVEPGSGVGAAVSHFTETAAAPAIKAA